MIITKDNSIKYTQGDTFVLVISPKPGEEFESTQRLRFQVTDSPKHQPLISVGVDLDDGKFTVELSDENIAKLTVGDYYYRCTILDNDVVATDWSGDLIVTWEAVGVAIGTIDIPNIIVGFKAEVVDELPATGIDRILYLVPKTNEEDGDAYKEYIWVSNAFEEIGSTDIDLSQYLKVSVFNSTIANYSTTTEMNNAIGTCLEASKTYTNTAIGNINSFDVLVVQSLPTENIKTHTIYFVPKTQEGDDDVYDEYMYINSTWEHIGSTDVDLSGYASKNGDASESFSALSLDIRGGGFSSESDIVYTNTLSGTIHKLSEKANTTDLPSAATQTTLGTVKLWSGTQAEYDAITTKVADCIYLIKEVTE